MKVFRGDGNCLQLTAPYALTSGQWLKIGNIFGVAGAAAASGDKFACYVEGEYEVTKVGSQAWTEGLRIYWDDSQKKFTSTNTSGNTIAGVATEAVGSGSTATTGKVRLSGNF